MLFFGDQETFAHGVLTYRYAPATQHDQTNRVLIPVEINESTVVEAVLDTGSPYTILDPDIASLAGIESTQSSLNTQVLYIRGQRIEGVIDRITLTLGADEGEDLDIDSTVLIPKHAEDWDFFQFPSFLGQSGFLERIRYAVDPTENQFYFGRL